jgi:hypothetical protein
MNQNLVRGFIISTFVSLYLVVSIISTIHVIDFFKLSNPDWLAVSLAIAFEIGAAASLASLIALEKMNKSLIWFLFLVLTAMQMMGNTYYAFTHLENYQSWVELFGLVEEEPMYQKRMLSILSGAILPLVALGFIKSLVDYIRPSDETAPEVNAEVEAEEPSLQKEDDDVWKKVNELKKEVDELKNEGEPQSDPASEELAEESAALAFDSHENDEELEAASLTDFIENPEFEDAPFIEETLIVEEGPVVEEVHVVEEPAIEESPILEEINTIEENQNPEETSDDKKKS